MISVIIPIYNSEKTLRRCVDSVLAQTCRALEVLIVDDGSADGSGTIADEYARADGRVKVFHQKNGGLSSARNLGLDHASGEFVAFVDADDWVEGKAYESALAALSAHAEAEICVFGVSTDDPVKSTLRRPAEEETVIDGEEALRRLIAARSLRFGVWNKLYRAALFDGLRFREGYNYEDILIMPHLFMKAGALVLIPGAFYHYVQTAGSIVHTPSLKNELDYWTGAHRHFELFSGRGREWHDTCLRRCVAAAVRAWSALPGTPADERKREEKRLCEVSAFIRAHRKEIPHGAGLRSVPLRCAVLLIAAGGRTAAYPIRAARGIGRLFRPKRVFR